MAVTHTPTWYSRGSWWGRDCVQGRGGDGRMKKMNRLGWWWKDEENEWGEAMGLGVD